MDFGREIAGEGRNGPSRWGVLEKELRECNGRVKRGNGGLGVVFRLI